MEEFRTQIRIIKEPSIYSNLPKTPFFIRDNEAMEESIFMVVNDGSNYSYINMETGLLVQSKDHSSRVLERLNKGQDTLLKSYLELS